MERLTIKNSDGTYSQPTHTTFEKMFYKLAEFEDFMEENGFKNLEELDSYIQKIHCHYDEIRNKGTCGFCKYLYNEENQALKDRWEKLRDWFQNKDFDHCTSRDRALAKMQELEKGENNESNK